MFDEVKKAKKHRYVVFVIKDDVMIDVEAIGDRDASYDDFVTDIQKAGKGMCRYGLFDYEYLHAVQGAAEVSPTCPAVFADLQKCSVFIEKQKVSAGNGRSGVW